jgi:hypothetical protein
MASYNGPTENIPSFNTLLFNQPEVVLTQAEADLLYLSKVSTDISTAGSTTFNGQVSVGGNITGSSLIQSNTTSASTNSLYTNLFTGSTLTMGTANSPNTINGSTTFNNTLTMTGGQTILSNAINGNGNTGSKSFYTLLTGTLNIGQATTTLINIKGPTTFDLNTTITDGASFFTRLIKSGATSSTGHTLFDNMTSGGALTIGGAASTTALRGDTTFNQNAICNNRLNWGSTAYSFPFASSQSLGYYLKATGTGTTITSATPTSILTTASIPIGVWRIDFSVINVVGATGAGTITQAQSYVSTTNNGAVATAVDFTGSVIRSHTSEVYGNNDVQEINGSFTYQQSTAGVLYLNIVRSFSTGTYSFTGEVAITRLA